ncbi:MAG: hypothetical protein HW412_1218 [Bacteroidetes bacterium]|nr:hypothetical protein [Bacteroidota bacterium]
MSGMYLLALLIILAVAVIGSFAVRNNKTQNKKV